MRFGAISEFFKRLGDGDPVAIGFVVGFFVLLALAMVIVYFVRRSLRRDEEEWARRRGRKPKY
jgi:hypothetical protein